MPTLSEDDQTIIAAEELVKIIDKTIKLKSKDKLEHAKIIEQLTEIIANKPLQRVPNGTPQRVATPSTSSNVNAARNIQNKRFIPQRKTRSNTPMPAIIEEPTTPEFNEAEWYESPRPARSEI